MTSRTSTIAAPVRGIPRRGARGDLPKTHPVFGSFAGSLASLGFRPGFGMQGHGD